MPVTQRGLERLSEADLDEVRGGEGDEAPRAPDPAPASRWKACASDVAKYAAGGALIAAARMPPSTKLMAFGIASFHGGMDIGTSCPPAVQRVFGVGPHRLFPAGAYR